MYKSSKVNILRRGRSGLSLEETYLEFNQATGHVKARVVRHLV